MSKVIIKDSYMRIRVEGELKKHVKQFALSRRLSLSDYLRDLVIKDSKWEPKPVEGEGEE